LAAVGRPLGNTFWARWDLDAFFSDPRIFNGMGVFSLLLSFFFTLGAWDLGIFIFLVWKKFKKK
jgi:hypothetical protein